MVLFNKRKLNKHYISREGEVRLGDSVNIAKHETVSEVLASTNAKYVILGIPEDIGPRANGGKKGCSYGFDMFIKEFLKIQDNQFLSGENILVLGEIDCFDLLQKSHDVELNNQTDFNKLQELVEELDHRVEAVLLEIFKSGKTPVIIGGGHNNSYPILKALSKSKSLAVQCLNFDAHADLRKTEGRHSGNGFSYAKAENYLSRYFVIGLQESYNNQHILNRFNNEEELGYISFEDIIYKDLNNEHISQLAKQHFNPNKNLGIEIDVDCMANVPSSAMTPIGFSERRILCLLNSILEDFTADYLHITEASISESYQSGKLLSSLASTFIKSNG